MNERDIFYGTRGPRDAQIVLVGEAWGVEEERHQLPFVGQSGVELDRILRDAHLDPNSILFTNVVSARPQGNEFEQFLHSNEKGQTKWRNLHPNAFCLLEIKRLYQQISSVKPRIVIAAGNYALWAMTDCCSVSSTKTATGARVLVPGGITSWRGSMLESSAISFPVRILPIIHPASILRAWYQRAITVHDLSTRVPMALSNDWRPAREKILAPGSFDETIAVLERWLRAMNAGESLRLAHDIETSRGLITCMGFADSDRHALVIPFVRPSSNGLDSYWSLNQEALLARLIGKVLSHPRCLVEGQNYIYDTQYIQRYYGITPKLDFDTMLAHHLLFPGTPKGLDYLSSLYCRYHWYWKEDLKEWDQHINFDTNLQYNAIDVMRTFECATELRRLIVEMDQEDQWRWERKKAALALEMMNRGVSIGVPERAQMAFNLVEKRNDISTRLHRIIPQSWITTKSKKPWFNSPSQTAKVFYDILGLVPQKHRKTGNVTVDDEAIKSLQSKVPLLSPLFKMLEQRRSIDVFHNTFISAKLNHASRMQCSFNPAGTETFRWSSSSNAFGGGTNLQNVPKGDED